MGFILQIPGRMFKDERVSTCKATFYLAKERCTNIQIIKTGKGVIM